MYNLPFTGNLVADPELITNTKSGTPRLNFKLAINEGERGSDNEKSHFVPFTAFGTLAENAAASLKKGQRVSVVGRLNTYEKDVAIDGKDVKLTMIGFTATSIAPDLRWATAKVSKVAGKSNEDSFPSEEAAAPARKAAPAKAAAKAAPAADDDEF